MSDQPGLFDPPTSPLSEEESEVAEYIAALQAESPLTPYQKVTARMARSLAKSIAAGNRKGRSVASDVERLMATMRELSGKTDDEADELTPAEKELLDALSSSPRHDPAATGYTT